MPVGLSQSLLSGRRRRGRVTRRDRAANGPGPGAETRAAATEQRSGRRSLSPSQGDLLTRNQFNLSCRSARVRRRTR